LGKFNYAQTNFTSGELSQRLRGRVDVDKYFNGAASLKNFIPMPTGGAFRTPGTVYVGPVKDHTEKARLVSFEFSVTQAYVLEFNDGFIRFYRNGGIIVETSKTITGITQANPAVVTSAGHGYSNGDEVIISGVVGMTQVNNKRFIVAGATANTFQLSGINSTGYTAYSSGGIAERIYQIAHPYAESDLFELNVDAQDADIMYIFHEDYQTRKLSRTGHTAWTLTAVDFVGAVQTTNTTSTTITPSADTGAGITLTASTGIFSADHVGSIWRVKNGYVKITAFALSTSVTATVQAVDGVAGNLGTGPAATTDWAEALWSDDEGWPACGTFHEDRLVAGGSTNYPQTIAASVSGSYENFVQGADDDDAFIYTLASERVNVIRWFMSHKVLAIGTSGGVFSMSSGSSTAPVTPTNVVLKPENSYGVSQIAPKRISSYVYFMQRDQRKLRELGYSIERDNYNAINMTILSEHITSGQIVDMDYQESPDGVLWCVRGDGKIATLTREVDQQVAAWAEQSTDGIYESVCVIPNGEYNQVWVVVKRTINGATKRYVEYFAEPIYDAPTLNGTDCFYVHSGLTYDGASTSTLTGLDHLEGKSVTILGNGLVQASKTVSNGSITLDTAVTKAVVGLPYTPSLKTMKLEAGSAVGSAQGLVKKINTVLVSLYETGNGVKVGNTEYQDELPDLTAGSLYTVDREVLAPGGFEKDGQIYLEQPKPLPCNVLLIVADGSVHEG